MVLSVLVKIHSEKEEKLENSALGIGLKCNSFDSAGSFLWLKVSACIFPKKILCITCVLLLYL